MPPFFRAAFFYGLFPFADDKTGFAVYTILMESSRIRLLAPEVARRIAAGEVIDRPAAALRELLDNSLDAGATDIAVELEGGGIEALRVVDNGRGMDKDDIAMAILPHATSKISALDDLLTLSTLGFRGEALGSMAAVARLELTSATRDDEAWSLESDPKGQTSLRPSRGSRGTSIVVKDLFATFPARKKFLKRPAAEATACRTVFLDKAMAFPDVAFRFVSGGKSLIVLRSSTLLERVLSATNQTEAPDLYRELMAQGTGFKARIIVALPAVYRTDRRQVQTFINGRRVQEYGISQALEYAYRGALPGGTWPFAYAFVEVDPEYADFNIHPAKKEVRLKNLDEIRSGLIRSIRDYLGSQTRMAAYSPRVGRVDTFLTGRYGGESSLFSATTSEFEARERQAAGLADERSGWNAIAESVSRVANAAPSTRLPEASFPERGFRYIGRALGVFLAFELGDEFVLLDQHAAHERCLYDEILSGKTVSQDLLVPVVYEPESDDEDDYIARNADALAEIGFRLTREGRSWLLEAAPAMLPESVTGSLVSLFRSRPDPLELVKSTAAQAACRAAVKDGDELDETGAIALIEAALRLPDPHCPHGRPIWLRLSREELFHAVRRIV